MKSTDTLNRRMSQLAACAPRAGLALMLSMVAAQPAAALDVTSPRIDVAPINPRVLDRGIDLQALRNQQQRNDFRQQQDRYRQDDRDAASQRERDVRVPVMKPNCRAVRSGNGAITVCP